MALEKEDIMALIAILQKGLVDDPTENQSAHKTTNSKKRSANKTKSKKEDNKPKRVNLFDSMPERHMHKEDVEIDRKLRIAPPTERSRKYIPISVKCAICGKTETISPALMENRERYKCNKCATLPG